MYKKFDHLAAHSSMSAIQVLCTFCSWYFVNLISVLFLDLLCNDLHLHASSLNFSQKIFVTRYDLLFLFLKVGHYPLFYFSQMGRYDKNKTNKHMLIMSRNN